MVTRSIMLLPVLFILGLGSTANVQAFWEGGRIHHGYGNYGYIWYPNHYDRCTTGYQAGVEDARQGNTYESSGHTSWYCSGYYTGYYSVNQQLSQTENQNQQQQSTSYSSSQSNPVVHVTINNVIPSNVTSGGAQNSGSGNQGEDR
jgi:hypothetical protein